jgi:hypothetical protein
LHRRGGGRRFLFGQSDQSEVTPEASRRLIMTSVLTAFLGLLR